jgi:hypothetical protein
MMNPPLERSAPPVPPLTNALRHLSLALDALYDEAGVSGHVTLAVHVQPSPGLRIIDPVSLPDADPRVTVYLVPKQVGVPLVPLVPLHPQEPSR